MSRRWFRGPVLGALLGLPILGGGGRPRSLALFLPIVLLYGALLERAWHARSVSPRLVPSSS
jgi:hypothetical protein